MRYCDMCGVGVDDWEGMYRAAPNVVFDASGSVAKDERGFLKVVARVCCVCHERLAARAPKGDEG